MPNFLVVDAEFNRLDDPDVCHCVGVYDLSDNFTHLYEGDNVKAMEALHKRLKGADRIIGHNFIRYDLPNLNRIFGWGLNPRKVIDTLVVSRMLNFKIKGGHSVEAWAERLNLDHVKVKINDFSVRTPELDHCCLEDVAIQAAIYRKLEPYLGKYPDAFRLEHDIEIIATEAGKTGFPFDTDKATELYAELSERLAELDALILESFPPQYIGKGTLKPRVTQKGTIHAADYKKLLKYGYEPEEIDPDVVYPLFEKQEFNPGSHKQVIERLWEAGWKPTDKTKGHKENKDPDKEEHYAKYGYRLSEENISTLPKDAPPGCKYLVERMMLSSRVGDLEEWLSRSSNGRITYQMEGIGGWTHRLATRKPNLQNIPVPQKKDSPSELDLKSDEINARMRQMFKAEDGLKLVGTDADGIQMRIFCHYIDDDKLRQAILTGDKAEGTDIHSLHMKALGPVCKGRNPAKTFIYAWLLGAGVGKVSEILECTKAEAKKAIEYFIDFYPGLKYLKNEVIPTDTARKYFFGLDKRPVMCDNTHLMMSGYLQNGEAVIMKRACRIWTQKLDKEWVYYRLHAWPHDEWQTSANPEEAEYVGQVQADSIRQAGEELGLKIPLLGQYIIGDNWLDTH